MSELFDIVFVQTWWAWDRDRALPYSALYHWFNVFEGLAWFAFAGAVLARYVRCHKSPLELWYALAFVIFGITDLREAWYQQSWLIWFKAVNLAVLIWLRAIVMRRYYPNCKLY